MLKELEQKLFHSKDSSASTSCLLVLHGTPGVGKSSLAYCLAKTGTMKYSMHAVGVELRGVSTLLSAALRVLQRLGEAAQIPQQQQYDVDEDEALAAIANAVRSFPWRSQGLVLVLDNTEELQRGPEHNVPLAKLIDAICFGGHRVIVTSRQKHLPHTGVVLTVPKLDHAASRECFLAEVEHHDGMLLWSM